ncbi:MAG: hypothetical protein M0T74_07675 [Desulfitobacterium hafniense]|nr:hypothetical protein [Desulfitobacterium hafniense]
MHKLWNVLLFPARLYEKLTDNKATLIAGIILVGLIDFFMPDPDKIYKAYFTNALGKSAADIQWNIAAAVFIILFLGLIDVIFFSIPLYDIFKFFKKKEGQPHQATAIKVIKAYIMSHFLIIPVSEILHFTVFRHITQNSSNSEIVIAEVLFLLIMVWTAAVVTRGINSLFKPGFIFRRFTFLIVFIWNYLIIMVFDFQILNWLFKLLK